MQQHTPQVPFVDLTAQYATLSEEIDRATQQVLRNTDFILGQDVDRFEEEFAAFCETQYAVAVDSGTSALELALRAYDIGPGDEVITPANTFIASALAVSYTGATPVFVDIDPQTYTIDPDKLEKAISRRTKAVIPVHLYGHPADMDAVLDIARTGKLIVIEDACQAHGARYKGRRVGSFGHAAAFSFYPAKNLGAYGDGGAIVTNDGRVNEFLRMFRNYGQQEKYHHAVRGFNRRLDTLQAAVLRVKLRYLDEWNAMRCQHAALYSRILANGGVVVPIEANYAEPVWHLYVVRTTNRNALQAGLANRSIATGIHYPIPIHLQQAYRDLGHKKGDFPVTEQYAEEVLSLPMYPELTRPMIQNVAAVVRALAVGI
ncbi:MAG: DegT/DnrJ/EryC1/StrS family aminotransferase [Candidatus Binatia bacterium]